MPSLSRTSLSPLLLIAGLLSAAQAQQPCSTLREDPPAGIHLTAATLIPAGAQIASNAKTASLTGAANNVAPVPEHCMVQGQLEARTGPQGGTYAIGFELRLPTPWNGGLLYQGGGGMDGIVNPALGSIPIAGSTAAPALMRGYAVVSTDSGHQGKNSNDASFGLDTEARADYAYAAIGKVETAARQLLQAYYRRSIERSYFMGCSNGGREALIAAERFPALFDGVIAGNPGFHLSHAAIAQAWDTQTFLAAAPRDAQNKPVLANALTPAEMDLLAGEILTQCDALDGARDGQIDAMNACHFQVEKLACANDQQTSCLRPAQIAALKKVFDGAHDSHGHALYSSWPWDAGVNAPGWRAWKLGTAQSSTPNALNAVLASASLGYYFLTPAQPDLDETTIDFDHIAARVAATGVLNDATTTDLTPLIDRGGKLIVVQGNSDPVFSANDLRQWWNQLAEANGGPEALARSARLFIVPGMTHCGGGPALDDLDPLTALEQWQQHQIAPRVLEARGKSFPGRTRPICPYPQEAHYIGSGSLDAFTSFRCVSASSTSK